MAHQEEKDPALHIPGNFREEDELAQLEDSADVDKLRSLLKDKEVVYRLVKCFHDNSDGVLAATNKRIIFADQRFITSKVVSFQYQEIAAIVYGTQITTQYMTLVHSNQTLCIEKVDREHGARFVEFVQQAIGSHYAIEGNGHVFRHNDDMLQLSDLPRMNESTAHDSLTPDV